MTKEEQESPVRCPGCGHLLPVEHEFTSKVGEVIVQGEPPNKCPMCGIVVSFHQSGTPKELRVESEDHNAVAKVSGAALKLIGSSSAPAAYERVAVFFFGVVFIVAMLVIAVAFPEPTSFQYVVFRIVLALAASGVAAFVPGFLQVDVGKSVRAGGAIAVFVIIYFFSPAGLVTQTTPDPAPTDPFTIHFLESTPQGTRANRFTFPYADVSNKASYSDFTSILRRLPGSNYSKEEYTIFRIRDEFILRARSTKTAVSGRNTGVLVVPNAIIRDFESEHLAFTYLWNQIQQATQPNEQAQATL